MTDVKPETLDFRRTPEGVEITLLKPPLLKGGRKRFTIACLVSLGILVAATAPCVALSLYGDGPSVTFVFPLVALVVGAGILATELNWDRQIGVVSITDGHLTLLRDPLAPARQWPVKNVANVSAWVYANVWELKVELKEGKPVCCFRGRSRVELQFCAGLLRAALAPPRPALAPPRPALAPPRPALAPPRPAPVEKVVYVAGGVCQICGTAMDDRIVYCAKCRTPHHEECWMYNGACSTYGCREIRMTRSA